MSATGNKMMRKIGERARRAGLPAVLARGRAKRVGTGVKRHKTEAQLLLETHLTELGIAFTSEHRFHPERRWRFDYVATVRGVRQGIEVEGGSWIRGRHSRGKGFEGDLEKYATAMSLGWLVWRFSPGQIKRGEAKEYLRRWLEL